MVLPNAKGVLLCVAAAGYCSILLGSKLMSTAFLQIPRAQSHAMNQYGKWEIMESNDPLVGHLPRPRIVEIRPGGFRIGKHIFGAFRLEPSSPNVFSMTMYNIPWLKRYYTLEPLTPDRMTLLSITGSSSPNDKETFYVLHRYTTPK